MPNSNTKTPPLVNPKKTVISPNLLPTEEKEELYFRTIASTANKVVLILSIMVLAFWIIGGILLWRISSEKNNISQNLSDSIDNSKMQELKKMNDQFKELRTLSAKVDNSFEKEYRFSEVLDELANITPQGVVLTDFETILEQPGWVRIKGAAQNRAGFLLFKKGLESSKFYTKVESPLSNYVSPESISFELNAQLKDWTPSWAAAMKKKPVSPVNTQDKE